MRSSHTVADETRSRTAAFRQLADGRKRHLLAVVDGRSRPVGTRDLAARLASFDLGTRPDEVGEDDRDRAYVALRHALLPALVDADLLELRDGGDAVAPADHPLLRDGAIAECATDPDRADDESLDALFDALADPRRRAALASLAGGSVSTTAALARDVAALESNRRPRAAEEDRLERIHASLVHAHLPRLSDAGLVAYDPDDSLVGYAGHPDLRARWLDAAGEAADAGSLRRALPLGCE